MNSFEEYYKKKKAPRLDKHYSKELEEAVSVVWQIKERTQQPPFHFAWISASDHGPGVYRKILEPAFRNPNLSRFKRVVARRNNPNGGRDFTISLQSTLADTFIDIEIPNITIPNFQTDPGRNFLLKSTIRDIHFQYIYAFDKKFEVISLSPFLFTGDALDNILDKFEKKFSYYDNSRNTNAYDAASVVNFLAQNTNIIHSDLIKLKVKHGVPLSDDEMTDETLAGIV